MEEMMEDNEGPQQQEQPVAVERFAENILPEEIWEKIFGNVVNPIDLLNGSRTCHLFQDILSPSNNIWLFELVFPHLYKYLDGKSILTCREICKKWNGCIDKFLEEHRSLQPYSDETYDPRNPTFLTPVQEKCVAVYKFKVGQEEVIEKMRNHPRNPFIGRSVEIIEYNFARNVRDHERPPFFQPLDLNLAPNLHNVRREELVGRIFNFQEVQAFPPFVFRPILRRARILEVAPGAEAVDQVPVFRVPNLFQDQEGRDRDVAGGRPHQLGEYEVTQFLESLGHHIWYLKIQVSTLGMTNAERLALLKILTRGVFTHVPNLRKYEISGLLEDMLHQFPLVDREIEDIFPSPFPDAPNLESLSVDLLRSHKPHMLQKYLLRRFCTQLKSLYIKYENVDLLSPVDFPKLSELSLEGIPNDEKSLWSLIYLKAPQLKKLHLGVTVSQLRSITAVRSGNRLLRTVLEVVNALCSSSPQLRILSIPMGIMGNMSNCEVDPLPLNLFAAPSIKSLEIYSQHQDPSLTSFSFLLRFPFLENLHIYWLAQANTPRRDNFVYHELSSRHAGGSLRYRNPSEFNYKEYDKYLRSYGGNEVEIQKYMYNGRMYESNVWKVLPCLKVFTFQNDVYTRVGYEAATKGDLLMETSALGEESEDDL